MGGKVGGTASPENVREQVRALLDGAEPDDAALPLLHRQEVWLRASLLCGFADSSETFIQNGQEMHTSVLQCSIGCLWLWRLS